MIKRILAGVMLALAISSPAYAAVGGADPAPPPLPDCAAYVYKDTANNLCGRFAGRTDVNCTKIGGPVEVARVSVDPWHLDRDNDRIGCDYGPHPRPSHSPSPSPSASASASPSASVSTSASSSPSASASTGSSTPSATTSVSPTATVTAAAAGTPGAPGGPALPVTGPSGVVLVAMGLLALAIGVLAIAAVRRRRTRFTA